jgi:hypothetical protein
MDGEVRGTAQAATGADASGAGSPVPGASAATDLGAFWLERRADGPPLARVSLFLHPTEVYGVGHDDTSSVEDLLDEMELWSAALRSSSAPDPGIGPVEHLTRSERRRWLKTLPRDPQ